MKQPDRDNLFKIGFAVLLFAVVVLLFHQTVLSMISIWERSNTYTHGFFILPISLWLIWERRHSLIYLPIKPEFKALISVALFLLLWIVGKLVFVLSVQQFAFVGILISCVWVVFGSSFSKQILFPLLFLFFAVPMGDFLIPWLQDITADFAVIMIRMSGIPVYREDLYIHLPGQSWLVIDACSGIRYLIASLALGFLFAFRNYSKAYKRFFFIILSVVVPIIANGIRAYIVVIMGYITDSEFIKADGHIIIGWIIFGIVIFSLFFVGSIWSDREVEINDSDTIIGGSENPQKTNYTNVLTASLIALLLVGSGPLFLNLTERRTGNLSVSPLSLPDNIDSYSKLEDFPLKWRPSFINPDKSLEIAYSKDHEIFGLFVYQYLNTGQNSELINSQNQVISSKDRTRWQRVSRNQTTVNLATQNHTFDQYLIRSRVTYILVWTSYRIGDIYTTNQIYAKFLEAINKIFLRPKNSSILIFSTVVKSYPSSLDQDSKALYKFISTVVPELEHNLSDSVGSKQ